MKFFCFWGFFFKMGGHILSAIYCLQFQAQYFNSWWVASWSGWSWWHKSFIRSSPGKLVQGRHITMAGRARKLLFSVSFLHNPLNKNCCPLVLAEQLHCELGWEGFSGLKCFWSLLQSSPLKNVFISLNHAGNFVTNNTRFYQLPTLIEIRWSFTNL